MRRYYLYFLTGLMACAEMDNPKSPSTLQKPSLPSEIECTIDNPSSCGETIEGELGQWVWHPVSKSQCLDGSPTGFGVRLGSDQSKVVLFLEGGGACYNPWSCKNIYASKFDAEDFGTGKQNGIFNLDDNNNPFRTWTQVYIPYCSGDMHSGSAPYGEGYLGYSHWGYQNISLYLRRLVPSFKEANRIVLMGSSAGGFGATYNWLRVQRAFSPIPVDVIDDSGPFLREQYLPSCFHKQILSLWNQGLAFPKDCQECFDSSDSFIAHLEYTRQTLPKRRYALLTTTQDLIIRGFFSYALNDCAEWDNPQIPGYDPKAFAKGLDHYHQRMSEFENTFVYQTTGEGHVLLFNDFSDGIRTEQNGIKLHEWIEGFLYENSVESVTIDRPL